MEYKSKKDETKIESIAGEKMSAVAFVMDYIEFHFDGKILRSLNNPIVHIEGQNYRFPEAGSRDLLCSLIGKSVMDVVARDGISIMVNFVGGSAIEIPLSMDVAAGPEAAHFVHKINGPSEVW
jgi:hypothetical protein